MITFLNINTELLEQSLLKSGNVFLNYLQKCEFNLDVKDGILEIDGVIIKKDFSIFNDYNIKSVLDFDSFLGSLVDIKSNTIFYKLYQSYGDLSNMKDEVEELDKKGNQYNAKLNSLDADVWVLQDAIKYFDGKYR